MKIKYIAWKKVICSDVNRLIYGTQGDGLHNKGDQAIQNFNTINKNPGLWAGFTGGVRIPRKKEVEYENRVNGTNLPTTYNIHLANSVNPLRLWEDKNDTRKNPVKINHEIWDRSQNHAQVIIESWYLGYMRILKKILDKAKVKFPDNHNVDILLNYVANRLSMTIDIRANVLRWIHETQDGFCSLIVDTSFMKNENIRDLVGFVEQNFYVVVKCDDNGIEKNMALMADSTSKHLHPAIKALLESNEKGGEVVDIDVAMASTSPDSQRFLSALSQNHNIILYGPPGTGKTHMLTELIQSFAADVLFDDLDTEAPFRLTRQTPAAPTAWCTFHPSYSYENFVYGIKPIVVNSQLGFKPHIGPFLKQSLAASEGKRALLIIDEINRGRADDIFGNTTAILGHESHETVRFTHPIHVDGKAVAGLSTSDNLFIVGTMNSLDKSTSPLSGELKRKFTIVEVAPSVEVLRSHLQRNASIDEKIVKFCCTLMETINKRIHDFCGKEFELGQGFFWPLVNAQEKHEDVLADVICNKVMPHLRDVLPLESLEEFFKPENLGVLYSSNEYGYDFNDLSLSTPAQIINAFAIAIDSDYRMPVEDSIVPESVAKADQLKLEAVKEKLLRHHNVIITGVTGTGKSLLVNKLANDPFFVQTSKMFWHSSTDYTDTIEGISAVLTDDGKINYAILPGMIKQMADSHMKGPKLMIIEGINKCNPAEALGELITLLEADKRNLHVEGYEGDIQIPEDMYFLCTINPNIENQFKLDSAMKRRFAIANLYPDYDLLALYLNFTNEAVDPEEFDFDDLDSSDVKKLAVQVLKKVNEAIAFSVGTNYQIGHAVFWNIPVDSKLANLLEMVDNIVLPQIEDLCFDADVARKIFGDDSPAISILPYGVEVHRLSSLNLAEQIEALKGLLSHD